MVWCLVCRRVWQTDGVLSISHRGWDSGCGADTRQLPLSFPLSLCLCLSIFPFVIVKSLTSCTTGTETNSPLSRSLISTFCISFLPSIYERNCNFPVWLCFVLSSCTSTTNLICYVPCQTFLSLSLSLSLSLALSLCFFPLVLLPLSAPVLLFSLLFPVSHVSII